MKNDKSIIFNIFAIISCIGIFIIMGISKIDKELIVRNSVNTLNILSSYENRNV